MDIVKSIWKFEISPDAAVSMPKDAKILTIQTQGGGIFIWALVDTDAAKESRSIRIYGTGHELPADPGKYIGTFQMANGSLVFHAFEF
jgi:hypothetical protein